MRAFYIGFMEGLPEESYYYNGLLLINASLPVEKIIEIIRIYLEEMARDKAVAG